jgi:hypothetical protein
MNALRAGSNVDAWCTKCRLVLAHTIEAVADGVIKRVQCNTCHGKHQYKAREPGIAKISLAIKAVAPKSKSKATDFIKLLEGRDLSKAEGYHTARHFTKGDVINHATFGLGVVVDEKDVSKIEVLFETGPKILIHART